MYKKFQMENEQLFFILFWEKNTFNKNVFFIFSQVLEPLEINTKRIRNKNSRTW